MQVTFKKSLHGSRLDFPGGLRPLRLLFLEALLPLGVLVAQKMERFLVLILHAHAGNCIGLLSNTALLLSIDSKILVPFQYHITPCDSQPLHLFQFSHFWRRNFVIEVSTIDNQASISSDEFPGRKILIRF